MIKVERAALPAILDLEDDNSAASGEFRLIVDFMQANGGKLPGKMDFNAYRDDSVKSVLIKMFHGKCAYCEWLAVAGSDGDVEHYRPKKGVSDAEKAGVDHPGYWWLAMKWENLLLSCQHCNQSRRQLIHEPGLSEEDIAREKRENRLRTTGKLNRFPVENDTWIISHTDDVEDEQPMLLNPCEIDPEDLLEWDFERSISTVKAKADDPRAAATIDILGLNRRRLTEARVRYLNSLRLKRRHILDKLNKARAAPSEEVALIHLEDIGTGMAEIEAAGEPDREFAGLARAFHKQLALEIRGRIAV